MPDHRTFLRAENCTRSSVFHVRSRVFHPESSRTGLALLRVLAIFWWEDLDPFFFSPGASFEFFTVLPLSEKKVKKRFPAIYRRFIRKWSLFSSKSRPKLILSKLECVDIFQNDALKKWQAALMPLPKWLVGLEEKRARFARFPGQTRPRRCWNIHFQFLKPVCHNRWPEKVPELPFLKTACLNPLFTPNSILPILPQARPGMSKRQKKALKNNTPLGWNSQI